MMAPDDKRLSFLPLDQATVPPQGIIEHIKDRWWSYDPARGLIFYDKDCPQCNGDENLTRQLQERIYPWADVIFMPSVFRRIRIQDYC